MEHGNLGFCDFPGVYGVVWLFLGFRVPGFWVCWIFLIFWLSRFFRISGFPGFPGSLDVSLGWVYVYIRCFMFCGFIYAALPFGFG